MAAQRGITLRQYVRRRLGTGRDLQLLKVMMRRSFGAASYSEFWRYWNPVYGFYLCRLCYRPLAAFLPRSVSVLATFAVSGFLLHDLPFGWSVGMAVGGRIPFPFVTVWFLLIGIIVVLAEGANLNWADKALRVRVILNAAHVIVPGVMTVVIVYV